MVILVEGNGWYVISQSQGALIVGGWDMASSSLPASMGYATMWDGCLSLRTGEYSRRTVLNIGIWALDHDRKSNKHSLQLWQGPFSVSSHGMHVDFDLCKSITRFCGRTAIELEVLEDTIWSEDGLATKMLKVLKIQTLLQRTIRHLRPSKCDHLLLLSMQFLREGILSLTRRVEWQKRFQFSQWGLISIYWLYLQIL